MLSLSDKSDVSDRTNSGNTFRILELIPEEFENLISALVDVLPNYYVDPESIAGTLESDPPPVNWNRS